MVRLCLHKKPAAKTCSDADAEHYLKRNGWQACFKGQWPSKVKALTEKRYGQ